MHMIHPRIPGILGLLDSIRNPESQEETTRMAALPATTTIAQVVTTTQVAPVVTSSSAPVPETTPVVTSTAAVVTPSTSIAVVPTSTQIQSTILPTSTLISTTPLTTTTPTSTLLPSTSSTPTTTSTSIIPTSTSTSIIPPTTTTAPQTSTAIVTVTSVRGSTSAPGLVTSSRATSSAKASASAAAGGAETGKSGIGGSGLSLGALIGIIAGGLVFLIILALLVTRSLRKKARQRRTANRSSLFEPWPAPVAMEEEDGYEKGSYPMQEQPEYETNYPNYAGAGAGASAAAAAAAAGYTQHNQQPHQYVEYPVDNQPQQQRQSQGFYPPIQGQQGYADEGAAAGGAAGSSGLRDGSMVRVKVGFVRSLEDELAIVPGQQLYLHTAYDDGWSLCEDQNQTRGVVPVSCLEPWDEPNSMTRSNTNGSLNVNAAGQRRSSLYNNAQVGVDYLNMPQHG